MKFKEGDKVRLLEKDRTIHFSQDCIGKVGVVRGISDYDFSIEDIGDEKYTQIFSFSWPDDILELVETVDGRPINEEDVIISPYIAIEASKSSELTITLPKGTKLLEGEFEASNGDFYKVRLERV